MKSLIVVVIFTTATAQTVAIAAQAESGSTLDRTFVGGIVMYFVWGFLGGFLVDGLELAKELKALKNKPIKRIFTPGYITGELVRFVIGGVLSMVLFLSNQINTPIAGIIVGITAPMIIERHLREPPKAT